MPTFANITPIAKPDGIVYASSVPLISTEADLYNGTAIDGQDPVQVAYGQAIVAVVQLVPNGIIVGNSTYVVMQTDLGDGVWIEDLGSRNGVVIAGRPIGRKPVEIEVGAPFYLGNHRFTLGIEGKGRQDPTVETTSLGPAKVSQPGSRAAGDPAAPPSRAIPSTTATLDATEGMMLAGRAQLADAERPAAVRFSDALHVVQDLAAAGAEQKARLLLTEALDILASRPPMPELSPFLVASVRSMISRWSAHTDTPTWKQRVATLERWRRG